MLKLDECVNVLDALQTKEDGISVNDTASSRNHEEMTCVSSVPAEDTKFDASMFAALERHMLMMLQFKINLPTPLDFALFFAHRAFEAEAAQQLV